MTVSWCKEDKWTVKRKLGAWYSYVLWTPHSRFVAVKTASHFHAANVESVAEIVYLGPYRATIGSCVDVTTLVALCQEPPRSGLSPFHWYHS